MVIKLIKTIIDSNTYKYEIEKSKFIGSVFRVENEDQIKDIIKQIKKENVKATHNCYAYVISNHQKSNDDGEPSGTAGLPILEAIKNQELENVLVVVTRYFGGIKLGASNLSRTYGLVATETMKSAKKVYIKEYKVYSISFGYSLTNAVNQYLTDNKIKIIDRKFEENIEYLVATENENFSNDLFDYTNGKISIKFVEIREFESPQ